MKEWIHFGSQIYSVLLLVYLYSNGLHSYQISTHQSTCFTRMWYLHHQCATMCLQVCRKLSFWTKISEACMPWRRFECKSGSNPVLAKCKSSMCLLNNIILFSEESIYMHLGWHKNYWQTSKLTTVGIQKMSWWWASDLRSRHTQGDVRKYVWPFCSSETAAFLLGTGFTSHLSNILCFLLKTHHNCAVSKLYDVAAWRC